MFDLKPISKKSIPAALDKATHYRLLNQSWQAESICRDILNTDPDNQPVIYTLVLAITDQFEGKYSKSLNDALEMAEKLTDTYQKYYCSGLIYERQAAAAFNRRTPRSGYIAYEHLIRALEHYKKAEEIRPDINEEAILRWNACVRFLNRHNLKPSREETERQPLLDV
jgi:tetratricopeptide (TPR) repeat protein